MPRAKLPAVLAVAALLCVAACAPPAATTAASAPGYSGNETEPAAHVSYGVIVAMRRIGGTGTTTGAILGAVGGGLAGGAPPDSATAFEFIIRQDNGQTVSVVQTNEEGLRPGERVALSMGTRTRLTRAAS